MLDPLKPRNPNNGVDGGSIPISNEKFLSSENVLIYILNKMKVKLEVPVVKNLMIENFSSLQPTQIWPVKRHSVKFVLNAVMKNIGPTNLKRVKISMV